MCIASAHSWDLDYGLIDLARQDTMSCTMMKLFTPQF